jgi:diguanylate cyclase (GGDEF)-like protein
LPVDPLNPSALLGGMISSLLLDRRGRLWVGVFGRGIQVEDYQDDDGRLRFRRLSTHDGLPQNSVDMLLMDAKGSIWASTDDGLAQIDPENLTVRAYRAEQGVGIRGHWVGAGTVTATGELVFGGIGGLTVVHPDRPASASAPARLTITEARVGGRPVPAGALMSAQPLQIAARDRSLFVEFSALDFTDPKHQRYSYRLTGFDPDWVNTPNSRRLASYTNLPPGEYNLQIRVSGPDGQWMPPLERAVHVQPAWYQQTGLRIAGLIVGILLLIGLVQLRTMYLRQRQRQLQRLVAERTAELERRGIELRHSQEQLEQMAYFDSLTGLPNRRMFNDELRRLIARSLRGQGDFALLLVDLDGFKQVNDLDGHDAGDALLVAVADRLKTLVRETDSVARLGGDEFAVLLPRTDEDGGVDATCARMLASLGEPLQMDGRSIQATASIGVAVCPQEGTTADGLYKSADLALYEAKRAGRNTWRWRMRETMPV